MRVRVLAPARRDLADATVYYEDQMPGLGIQFLDEVQAAIIVYVPFRLRGSRYRGVPGAV